MPKESKRLLRVREQKSILFFCILTFGNTQGYCKNELKNTSIFTNFSTLKEDAPHSSAITKLTPQ